MSSSLRSSAPSSARLTELHALLLSTDTLPEFLDELARLTVRELPEGSSCGVTVRRDGWPITLASSDALTKQVDQLQYEHGEGPCLDTLSSGVPNSIPDTATEQRWPSFCADAHAQGVRSCLSLPLKSPTGVVGAYNLYSTHPDGFQQKMWPQLEGLAGNAAGALAVAVKLADQAQLSEDLRQALTSRSVIDQAIGIIMAQQRCDASAAFDMLRRASQNRNIKLREVAAEIVEAVAGHPPEPGTFQPRN